MRILLIVLVLLAAVTPAAAQSDDVLVQVTAWRLNVRSGPGVEHSIIGELKRGNRVILSGISQDRAWLYFMYWDQPAYIAASQVQLVAGDLADLTPPAPAPGFAGEVQISGYQVDPPVPAPGTSFYLHLTLTGDGHRLGAFSVAAECASFVLTQVSRLATDGEQRVSVPCPGDTATGPHTANVVVDVERTVSQGTTAALAYFIDRPLETQGRLDLAAYTNLNLSGEIEDLANDGLALVARNGAQVARIPEGVQPHYDMLADVQGESVALAELVPGDQIGVILAEGQRAVLRVVSLSSNAVELEYGVYVP
jgi:hypothetical protein